VPSQKRMKNPTIASWPLNLFRFITSVCSYLASTADRFASKNIRLYDALRNCNSTHWKAAFTELSITLIFSLLPIWIPLIAIPMFRYDDVNLSYVFHNQIRNGELYIIATGLLAPIFYFTFPQYKGVANGAHRPFPSQQLLILIFIFVTTITSISVTAISVEDLSNGIPDRMIVISAAIFLLCTLIFLLSLVVRNAMPDLATQEFDGESRRETQDIPPPGIRQDFNERDTDSWVDETIRNHAVRGAPNED